MTLAEVMPSVRQLPRQEKLELMRVLTNEVEEDQLLRSFSEAAKAPFWLFHDQHEAARVLTEFMAVGSD